MMMAKSEIEREMDGGGEMEEDVCEKVCVFEESLEIDFDYEFDVAKFYDFTRVETIEEIVESELWFQSAEGYPPSPLVIKVDWEVDESGVSETSTPKYRHQNTYSINDSDHGGDSEASSLRQGRKGHKMLDSKSKSSTKPLLPRGSRLLQPTASQLAKQNQQICIRPRIQRLGSPIKCPGEIVATKRQKLEIGYLRKAAHLKHQTLFSHKSPKKLGSTDGNSSRTKQKATVPKEPDLETAQRAQRRSSKNTAQSGSDPKSNSCAFRARPLNRKILEKPSLIQPKKKSTPSLQELQGSTIQCANSTPGGVLDHRRANSRNVSLEKSDPVYRFNARPSNKKMVSSKGDIGVLRSSKRAANVSKEFRSSNSKKLSEYPPVKLFDKLSLNSENHPVSSPEDRQPLQTKVLNDNVPCSTIKENKIASAVAGKLMRCCLKQSQFGGRNLIMDNGNHLSSARSIVE